MKSQHILNEIKGVIILALALILFASLISFVPADLPWHSSHPNIPAKNLIRIFGAYFAGGLLFVIGYSAYFIAFFLFFWSWNKFSNQEIRFSLSKFLCFCVLLIVASALYSMLGSQQDSDRFQRAGLVGLIVADFLVEYFGQTGSYIILGALATLTSIIIGEFLVFPFVLKGFEALKGLLAFVQGRLVKQATDNKDSLVDRLRKKVESKTAKPIVPKPSPVNNLQEKAVPLAAGALNGSLKPKIRLAQPDTLKNDKPVAKEPPQVIGEYHLPSTDLLKDAPAVSAQRLQDDLVLGAKTLESTLAQFGITVRVVDIERGPVITRYELEPAPGVRVQQITTLSDDIALAMKAQSVRILAPIPGKNRVGIEVPNLSSSAVFLKDVLTKSNFRNPKSLLTLALGKDTAGQALIADLADMPHLLVAGTTGSGKTVCLNSIILSMLFKYSPQQLKFLMVDPKMVELSQYNPIPHALCPAVTDPKKVTAALGWVVSEMESRYVRLSEAGSRNIADYLSKGKDMYYIVVVIDELADLMQICPKEVESAITRLAQLSRAVGIHLVLATQRPSVDVITGVIKANFPARISFKVASKVDSRTVLDMNGAENLIGKGDMLFLKPGEAKPIRGQCCYVSDDEIAKVIDFIKVQQQPVYNEGIVNKQTKSAAGVLDEKDELYDEAVRVVVETNQASVSVLQRRLRLGYGRAARLVDMMEQEGIVGPYSGSKARELLVNREEWLKANMSKDKEQTHG
jgi:S-DNA-T family DNA segregation ATPase FtsK/SpoIIIE